MNAQPETFVLIPSTELTRIKELQETILLKLSSINATPDTVSGYLTATEFMLAVRICRSKFDSLVQQNAIKTIKKKRKIYVPQSEVERYFSDPSIQ